MPIQILPARLANQIAAGEVVERPASVVKELVENSLDAGATRIDIEIEQGGAKCIRIKDNGSGVCKEQLTLALSRHATSKISHLDDLEAIVSLGFRGEALASVSSVSRLTFTSKPENQEQAWQAIAEGRDMQVNIQPAAHPQGTTVEVLDLFFNTPARRRFLKAEKTEFQHIDELIKRIALSRFDIAISLKHNNKMVRQYRAAPEQSQQEKRIAAICSDQFIQHAVFFEHADQSLKISGWISDRLSPRPLPDVQYCYINGRMIKDKLVNHAIKQVFAHYLPQGMFPGYIIYIECDAKEVDVNVHPAKHEVRFHQARWVHDFICSTLNTSLHDSSLLSHETEYTASHTSEQARVAEHAYQPPVNRAFTASPEKEMAMHGQGGQIGSYTHSTTYSAKPALDQKQVNAYCDFVADAFQQNITSHQHKLSPSVQECATILSFIDNSTLLIQPLLAPLTEYTSNGLLLLSLTKLHLLLTADHLLTAWENGEVISQPLLLPVRFQVDADGLKVAEQYASLLARLGFVYKFKGSYIIVSEVPSTFRHAPIATILPLLLTYLSIENIQETEQGIAAVCYQLSDLLVTHETLKVLSKEEVKQMLVSSITLPSAHLQGCFKQPDLTLLLKGLN
jgi:DNA mismatch repair protein MutL